MVSISFLIFAVVALQGRIFCFGADVPLSFRNFTSSKYGHVDAESELPPLSIVKILLTELPSDVDFLIVQAHSHFYNVVLSSNPAFTPVSSANGTNVGLFYQNQGPTTFYLKNPNNISVSVLAAAVPYTSESPVPGGCNLEAPLPIKPYLSLGLLPEMISVDGSAASTLNGFDNCDMNPFAYLMFYKYIDNRDFFKDTYFEAIRSMLTYPRILNGSYVALEPLEGPALKRMFSRYTGTGAVYSLIAFNKFGNVAVYTPSFSYGCDNLIGDVPCQLLSSPLLKIQFAILLSLSAFVCFAGHRYFLIELFYMGLIFGGFVSYDFLSSQASYVDDLMLMSGGIGIIFGVVWVCIWWFVNSPILSVSLPFLVNGILISSSVIFFFMSGFSVLQNDMNYWLTFSVFAFVIVLISTTNPVCFNMLACSIVGGYGMTLPLDYYIGSRLKYIIINVVRRATVEGFNLATTKPPLQLADWSLLVAWAGFIAFGVRSQKKLSANRSPFPPVCLVLREQSPETVPIVTNARFPTYS